MPPDVINQQLITSGILEAYLLGLTSEEEQNEVLQAMAADPEIFIQLSQLDTDLKAHFAQASVPPPPALRDVIELRASEQGLQKRESRAYTSFEPETSQNEAQTRSS